MRDRCVCAPSLIPPAENGNGHILSEPAPGGASATVEKWRTRHGTHPDRSTRYEGPAPALHSRLARGQHHLRRRPVALRQGRQPGGQGRHQGADAPHLRTDQDDRRGRRRQDGRRRQGHRVRHRRALSRGVRRSALGVLRAEPTGEHAGPDLEPGGPGRADRDRGGGRARRLIESMTMAVRRGRELLSIPGPTNIPEAVLAAMHRPAIDIYAGDMLAVTGSLLEDLPKIFRTTGRTYIYAANGHGGWEAALTNVLSRGETVLVLESGLFALGWGDMARMMGVKVEVLKGDPRRAVDPVALAQRLAADGAREIKAILVVQIDTASGVVNDLAAIHRAIASV